MCEGSYASTMLSTLTISYLKGLCHREFAHFVFFKTVLKYHPFSRAQIGLITPISSEFSKRQR